MMETVVFEIGWESFFQSHQLHRFDDFFYDCQGQVINYNTKRNVIVLNIEDHGRKRVFYMKRFVHPHIKDMLSAFCAFGKLCSQAEVEWRNAHILRDNGIETYRPVCYGFRSVCGIERQSFFITEEIQGCCLLDYLMQSWKRLGRNEQEHLIVKLARFFKKIHAAGLSLPDSYIWHVYKVNGTDRPEDYAFGMIDLHRMKIRTRGNRQAAMNLGRFLFSLPDGFMSEPLRSLFMKSYLDGSGIRNQDAFSKQVKQWELKISSRRKRELARLE